MNYQKYPAAQDIRSHVANPINTVALMKESEWTVYLWEHFGVMHSECYAADYLYEVMVQAIKKHWYELSAEARLAVYDQAGLLEANTIAGNEAILAEVAFELL